MRASAQDHGRDGEVEGGVRETGLPVSEEDEGQTIVTIPRQSRGFTYMLITGIDEDSTEQEGTCRYAIEPHGFGRDPAYESRQNYDDQAEERNGGVILVEPGLILGRKNKHRRKKV